MWRAALDKKIKKLSLPLILSLGLVLVSAGTVIAYYQHTSTHLPPNTYINNIYVGNLSYEEAESQLVNNSSAPPSHPVVVSVDGISVASESSQLGLTYKYKEVLNDLRTTATKGRLRDRVAWRVRALFSAQKYDVPLTFDDKKLDELLKELNALVAYTGQDPSVSLPISNNPNSIKIFAGKSGREINIPATKQLFAADPSASIAAIVASTSAELTEDEVTATRNRVGKYVGKSINFKYNGRDYDVTDKELVSFLQLPTGYHTELITTKVATLAAELNRAPQEPIFEYNKESLEVTKFLAPLNGQTLDESKTYSQILEGLQRIADSTPLGEESAEKPEPISYELTVATTPPKRSLADTNDLGIKERIGFGDSHYDHSIPNRIHNVAITTERISDHIVAPGAEFSFNKTLGDVSAETGYRTAYVIKNGQTELGDGGGVCQVSTTLFRSVLNAGLKVTRRLPHSYRVSYYELDRKPGVDATVYTGNTDFRFVNDTPGHILIHAEADSKNLYMTVNIYGTSDGRSTEIKDHITWNSRPAPAPQYFPDPTLPAGKLIQIDWAASGINSSFINVIKDKDGKVIREDKYVSNYRPWAAKYRQGTGQ